MKLIEIKVPSMIDADPVTIVIDALKGRSSIESVKPQGKDSVDVHTKRGDIVRFTWESSAWRAVVQGQKDDIYCGDIGSSAKDVVSFLGGINKAWYEEHDPHWED
jgi:hypothetical protein